MASAKRSSPFPRSSRRHPTTQLNLMDADVDRWRKTDYKIQEVRETEGIAESAYRQRDMRDQRTKISSSSSEPSRCIPSALVERQYECAGNLGRKVFRDDGKRAVVADVKVISRSTESARQAEIPRKTKMSSGSMDDVMESKPIIARGGGRQEESSKKA